MRKSGQKSVLTPLNQMVAQYAEIMAKLEKAKAKLNEERKSLEQQMEEYLNENAILKEGQDTVQLKRAVIGWQKNTDRLHLPTGIAKDDLIAKMRKLKLSKYIEESFVKEDIRNDFSTEPKFEELGFRLAEGKESFFVRLLNE